MQKLLKVEIENLKAENKALKIENAQLNEKLGLNSKKLIYPQLEVTVQNKKRTSKKAKGMLAAMWDIS